MTIPDAGYLARLWLARREEQIEQARQLHHTATELHGICVTCGTRWPCATWEALQPDHETPESRNV